MKNKKAFFIYESTKEDIHTIKNVFHHAYPCYTIVMMLYTYYETKILGIRYTPIECDRKLFRHFKLNIVKLPKLKSLKKKKQKITSLRFNKRIHKTFFINVMSLTEHTREEEFFHDVLCTYNEYKYSNPDYRLYVTICIHMHILKNIFAQK